MEEKKDGQKKMKKTRKYKIEMKSEENIHLEKESSVTEQREEVNKKVNWLRRRRTKI